MKYIYTHPSIMDNGYITNAVSYTHLDVYKRQIVDGDYRSILSKTLEYFTHKKIKHYNKFSKEGTDVYKRQYRGSVDKAIKNSPYENFEDAYLWYSGEEN